MPRKKTESIRSESVQEILGKVPNVFILWGNTVVFVMVLGILVFSYFIRYPVKLETTLEFLPISKSEKVYAPIKGILNQWSLQNGQVVEKEAFLGRIISEDGTSLELKSPMAGKFYASGAFGDDDLVHENDLLCSILPLEIQGQKAFIKMSSNLKSKVAVGQEVEIMVKGNNQEDKVFLGYVDNISSESNDMYLARILPVKGTNFFGIENSWEVFGHEQNATIIVDKPRVLEYFFFSTLDAF